MKHLVVMAKEPIAGRSKTRIARVMGDEYAVSIAKSLLTKTKALCFELLNSYQGNFQQEVKIHWCVTDPEHEYWQDLRSHFSVLAQGSGDLGERLTKVIEPLVNTNNCIVCIGMDCPFITVQDLLHAFEALDKTQCVIQPAHDGGYVLIGLSKWDSRIFQEIPWSTPKVLDKTLQQLGKVSFTVSVKESLPDIDESEDALAWQRLEPL